MSPVDWASSISNARSCLKAGFHIIISVKFLEATVTIISKRSSQMTEASLAIETILAYGSSEIDSSSILATETTGNHTLRAYIF